MRKGFGFQATQIFLTLERLNRDDCDRRSDVPSPRCRSGSGLEAKLLDTAARRRRARQGMVNTSTSFADERPAMAARRLRTTTAVDASTSSWGDERCVVSPVTDAHGRRMLVWCRRSYADGMECGSGRRAPNSNRDVGDSTKEAILSPLSPKTRARALAELICNALASRRSIALLLEKKSGDGRRVRSAA